MCGNWPCVNCNSAVLTGTVALARAIEKWHLHCPESITSWCTLSIKNRLYWTKQLFGCTVTNMCVLNLWYKTIYMSYLIYRECIATCQQVWSIPTSHYYSFVWNLVEFGVQKNVGLFEIPIDDQSHQKFGSDLNH
jgi:hypothetical protein